MDRDSRILEVLTHLERKIDHMSSTIVTRDQFDAALSSLVTTQQAALTEIATAITDLVAKVGTGGVTTPEDFTAELNEIQGLTTAASAAAASAQASDPGAPAPATPAS
jgi:hypothetical protein